MYVVCGVVNCVLWVFIFVGVVSVVGFGGRLADVSGGNLVCGLRFRVWVMFSILVTFIMCDELRLF